MLGYLWGEVMSIKQQTRLLARQDLNLLVVLDLLLKERHVSRVADEMFVSQSAISRSLKRLREMFDDPLFTRTAKGLIPTAKALQIGKQLKLILPTISDLFSDEQFDPLHVEQTFSLSIPPFISPILMPELYQYLLNNAPNISLTQVETKTNALALLDSNQLDFAFFYEQAKSPKYSFTFLGNIYPVLYVRKQHPLLKQQSKQLEAVKQYPLIGMNIENDANFAFHSPITQIFQDLSGSQKIPQLRSNQLWSLLNILRDTDSVLFGSNSLKMLTGFNEQFVELFSLQQHNKYVLPVYLVQHIRYQHSAAHLWMAELLKKFTTKILG